MKELNVSVLRGNAAEVAQVVGHNWEIKGVDAGEGSGNVTQLAIDAALQLNTTVAVTGKTDIVSDGATTYACHNGEAILTRVTGTGCLLTSVIGAFAAVVKNPLEAAVAAIVTYGVAAELAAKDAADQGPGSFQISMLNKLAQVSSKDIMRLGRVELL